MLQESVKACPLSFHSPIPFAYWDCIELATKFLDTQDPKSLPTILQFSSEDKFTKYEICQLFAEIMGLPLDGMVANAEGNDTKAAVQRPYDCHLSSQALKDLGINTSTMDFKGWWRREARAYRKWRNGEALVLHGHDEGMWKGTAVSPITWHIWGVLSWAESLAVGLYYTS
jgi:hypothetical protein